MSCLLGPNLVQTLTTKCCVAGSSKGFFDSSVGAQFATRTESPKKAAPKQAAPTKVSSGGGFFDSSIGPQFANRSESPKKAAPAAAPTQAAPTKASSGGFFDSSVGSQFANRSESPKKAAPKQAAPTASASGKLPALLLPHSQNVKGNALCSCTAKRAHLVLLVIVPARMSACSLSYNHPSIKVH